jgi:2,4-dichlorophenol 6-monooxygenase
MGIPIAAYVIGPGREYTDLYDDWTRLREVAEDGCVLVRPDAHVGWRASASVEDPAAELRRALELILDRSDGSTDPRDAPSVAQAATAG